MYESERESSKLELVAELGVSANENGFKVAGAPSCSERVDGNSCNSPETGGRGTLRVAGCGNLL